MGRIRNVSDINQARRWGMELLQNSRDVAYEGQAVRVQIELSETALKFRHTGKPFRVQDILSVINQVSSKTPGENTIGQFGTGFMTTYQLSESVEIHSILKDEGLPYKPFNIRIDRRGSTKEEILQGIQETMQDLKQADNLQDVTDFQKEAFNTCFCYHLENDESRKIAKIGMDDLENYIYDEQSDKYFTDEDEFAEHYWDLYLDEEKEHGYNFDEYFEKYIPNVLWNCEETKISMDADSIIVNACEELHEDARDNISDEKELQEFLDKWCAKQSGATSYYPCYREYVKVQKECFD